ncbi:hypothetical protein T01_8359 [Trichinella spiralis]|uniref:Uncharacterized protein n=1 Tax=Trichinella spiralis TaxID=6334 RepID=A0A0V1ARW9_TRISP|nr:hypothetical protein T01_8359 [Trichinella spiralis]
MTLKVAKVPRREYLAMIIFRSGRGRRGAAAIKPPIPPSSKTPPARTAGGFWRQTLMTRQGTPVADDRLGQWIKVPV